MTAQTFTDESEAIALATAWTSAGWIGV